MGGVKRNILLYSLCCCYVIPQYLCTGLHSQTVRFSSQVGIHMEQQSMCPQINVGEDRFPGFYIMSQFHIAELARRGTVKKVAGSSPQHVAYQIGPAFNFRINTRSAYPLGLPEEFAFVSVLRMSGSTITKNWNIWQMQDVNGDEQLSVRLNGESKSLGFTFTAADTGRQTVVFSSLPFLFNEQWHRVLLDVSRLSVTLFVDCVMIGSQNISPRQTVSLDGFTLIGKLKDNPVMAVPVRLLTHSRTFTSVANKTRPTHYVFNLKEANPGAIVSFSCLSQLSTFKCQSLTGSSILRPTNDPWTSQHLQGPVKILKH